MSVHTENVALCIRIHTYVMCGTVAPWFYSVLSVVFTVSVLHYCRQSRLPVLGTLRRYAVRLPAMYRAQQLIFTLVVNGGPLVIIWSSNSISKHFFIGAITALHAGTWFLKDIIYMYNKYLYPIIMATGKLMVGYISDIRKICWFVQGYTLWRVTQDVNRVVTFCTEAHLHWQLYMYTNEFTDHWISDQPTTLISVVSMTYKGD